METKMYDVEMEMETSDVEMEIDRPTSKTFRHLWVVVLKPNTDALEAQMDVDREPEITNLKVEKEAVRMDVDENDAVTVVSEHIFNASGSKNKVTLMYWHTPYWY